MSPNKSKRKGSAWESYFVELLERNLDGIFKRVVGSGAIGTIMDEPMLMGDIVAEFAGFPRKFRFENKTGYGGETQLTLKREWFNKIREEAINNYSVPAIACKFFGSRKATGVQYFVALDFDAFCDIMRHIAKQSEELDKYGKSK